MSLVGIPLLLGILILLGKIRAIKAALWGLIVLFLWTLYVLITFEESSIQLLGGWMPPLGISLHVKPLGLLFCSLALGVGSLVGFYGWWFYSANHKESVRFFVLLFFLLAGLNLIFLADDLFTLYVALEVVGFSAVGLSALRLQNESLRASLIYLFATLVGSGCYLWGVMILYTQYGTLSLNILSNIINQNEISIAFSLMALGLALKSALFPFHFWLPKAHANATAPVSALLSALVIKGSFYLLYRLWFDGGFGGESIGYLLGVLGGAGVLYATIQALLQNRLKYIIAYSTIAQIGYLCIVFGLTHQNPSQSAQEGAILLALSHGLAKASMFLSAGLLIYQNKSDHLNHLQGAISHAPLVGFSFALSAVTLMGLPPSLGFFAKWLLLMSAFEGGDYVVAAIFILGGIGAAAYLFRVMMVLLERNLIHTTHPLAIPMCAQIPTLLLALIALLLGMFTHPILEVLHA
jgi:formate hydrogenlyase subunit 3/multisubunit Na+/H+ antiporter MnhD subunit